MFGKTLIGLALATAAFPALAQQAPSSAATPAANTAGTTATSSATANGTPTVGATVYDAQGAEVGKVTAVAGGNATVDTGKNKAALPLASFAAGDKGPVIALSRDQLDQAAAGAKANVAASVTAGTAVKDGQGGAVGTIKSVDAQYAVLDTGKVQAKLPLTAFAQGDGGLVIGMTKSQVEAAAGTAAKK